MQLLYPNWPLGMVGLEERARAIFTILEDKGNQISFDKSRTLVNML